MPALKLSRQQERDLEVKATINKYITLRGLKKKNVAVHIRMSSGSLYNRISKPQNFKVGELSEIYDYLKVPEEERVGLI